jgi:predicted metal-dependent hydrolase
MSTFDYWLKKIMRSKQRRRRTRPALSPEHYKEHKEAALQLVQQRVADLGNLHDFKYNKVSVRNQRSRWGSCSQKGNLNFNYRILFLSKALQDYLIVHEMCHLKELNHSRKFWNVVQEILPNYREAKRELRSIQLS